MNEALWALGRGTGVVALLLMTVAVVLGIATRSGRPILGSVKPFWQGLGTVAVDLLAAILVTSLLRRWIGQRVFRLVHWFTYAMWPVALAHSIGNGTDGTSAWFLVLAGLSIAAVAIALAWRLSANFIEFRNARQGEAR
jgi:sulfoxide reductase heme-binding subunit YedZ